MLKSLYFDLLGEHYNRVYYYPNTEYRLANLFITRRYSEFSSEEEFRNELFKFKPLFIMNSVGELLFLDFDFKLRVFTKEVLQNALQLVTKVRDLIEQMIDVDDYHIVFSGRGFHLYVSTSHIQNIYNEFSELGFSMTMDFVATFNKTITFAVISNIPSVKRYLDLSSGSAGKMVRTPLSINNKSFLPVVPVIDEEDFDLNYIISVIREPIKYNVRLRRKIPVRVGERYELTDEAIIDEYELMRLLVYYNLIVKGLRVIK